MLNLRSIYLYNLSKSCLLVCFAFLLLSKLIAITILSTHLLMI